MAKFGALLASGIIDAGGYVPVAAVCARAYVRRWVVVVRVWLSVCLSVCACARALVCLRACVRACVAWCVNVRGVALRAGAT
jgi:hypothetical protein